MKEVTVTRFMENDTPIASLPLGNSERLVYLYLDDFYSLIGKGLDPRWVLSNGQILERGTRLSVTRLVADAKKGQKVRLLDKDCFNLRRSNLITGPGGGRLNVSDKLSNKEERPCRLNPVIIKYQDINPQHMKDIQQL